MSDRTIHARFYVDAVTRRGYDPKQADVTLKAAGRGEQNKTWAKYTPSGELTMHVTEPAVADFFEENLGRDLAMTFQVVGPERYNGEHAPTPTVPAEGAA